LERGVVHIFDLDALHGNHSGYRNRDGGTTTFAVQGNWVGTAPGIPDGHTSGFAGRLQEKRGMISKLLDAGRGPALHHAFASTNPAGRVEVLFVEPSAESGSTVSTWYIGVGVKRDRKKW